MLVNVDPATTRWIQKSLSRFRRKEHWDPILQKDEYWKPAVFEALVDQFDRDLLHGENARAVLVGGLLRPLADRIRPNLCEGGDIGRRSLDVWALAISGSVFRLSGNIRQAAVAFAEAVAKSNRGIHIWAKAELCKRHGFHLLNLGEHQAVATLKQAVTLAINPEQKAEALNILGISKWLLLQDESGALLDFGTAASISDPMGSERAKWALQAACHNMAWALVKSKAWITFDAACEAKKLLLAARKLLGPELGLRKLRSLWVEGLLVYRMGLNRHGERLLMKAKDGMEKLRLHEEAAVVGLDLAVLLANDGEGAAATELVRQVCDRLRQEVAPELIAGLLSRRLDLAEVESLRERLLSTVNRQGGRRYAAKAEVL